MELKQRSIGAVAGSFRKNADGHAVFYLLDCCKNRLHTSLEIAAVKEQAVQVFHPIGKQRNLQKFDLGNITGGAGHTDIGHNDIEIAAVITDIENRGILRNAILSDVGDGNAGQAQHHAERPVDNRKAGTIL